MLKTWIACWIMLAVTCWFWRYIYEIQIPEWNVMSLLDIFRVLYCSACLYRGKLEWTEAYPHKVVAAWLIILLTFLLALSLQCLLTSWLSHPIASRNMIETQDADFCMIVSPVFSAAYYVLIHTCHQEPMKSVGVMAPRRCCSLWTLWSDALWMTLGKL
jgi:hypothetical protein